MLPPEQILAAFMFAGMIVFLFAGFPVAFSLTSPDIFFGGLGVLSGCLRADFFDIFAHFASGHEGPTTRCWPFRSSSSWDSGCGKSGLARRCWDDGLLFGKMRAGIAIRWWWSARSSRRRPASSAPAVSPHGARLAAHDAAARVRQGADFCEKTDLRLGTASARSSPQRHPVRSVTSGVSVGDSIYRSGVARPRAGGALYRLHRRSSGRLRPEAWPPAIPEGSGQCSAATRSRRVTIALIPAFAPHRGRARRDLRRCAHADGGGPVGAVGGIVLTMVKRKVFVWDAYAKRDGGPTTRITRPRLHHPRRRQLLRAGLSRGERRGETKNFLPNFFPGKTLFSFQRGGGGGEGGGGPPFFFFGAPRL